ncbi:hypothetical protein CBOM_05660 [Ceraceosorus bombacis]|uniref:Uncharacterized protein n=1 Tax=Ceraceosorus bombacis TaxID=401625 RepID=A0A0P1BQQ1_9BASI|nr:hypothetical protein CBOM_05660 [Ceraceosorus bombacis]
MPRISRSVNFSFSNERSKVSVSSSTSMPPLHSERLLLLLRLPIVKARDDCFPRVLKLPVTVGDSLKKTQN